MQKTQTRFTYSDYRLLSDDVRRELVQGEYFVVPAPNIKHQTTILKLVKALDDHVEASDLGKVLPAPTDVVLSDENVVQPDILFVSNERSGIITADNIRGAPDLVVEVLSPSAAVHDREKKLELYARYRVKEFWIVDPVDESIQVLQLGAEGYDSVSTYTTGRVNSSVVTGFEIELSSIFVE